MWTLIYILIFLSAVVFTPMPVADSFWVPKEVAFIFLSLAIIASSLMIRNTKTYTYRNIWISIILIYSALSFCFVFYPTLLFEKAGNPVLWKIWSFRPSLNLIVAIFLMITLIENTDTIRRWLDISKFLVWFGGIYSVYAICQWLGIDQLFNNYAHIYYLNDITRHEMRMVTFMSNHFLTGCYIAIISPLALMFSGKRYKVLYCLMALAVILTKGILSICALLIGLLVYFLMNGRWRTALSVLILCVMALVIFNIANPKLHFFSTSGRVELWKKTLIEISNNQFTGYGLGSYANKFSVGKKVALHAHNEWLQIYHDFGLFGLAMIGCYCLGLLKNIIHNFMKHKSMLLIGFSAMFAAYLVVMFGGFPLRIAPFAVLGILCLSCLEILTYRGVGYGKQS